MTPKRKQDSMSLPKKLKRRDENPLRDIGLPKDTAVYKYEEGVYIYGDYLTILLANHALPGVGGKYGGRTRHSGFVLALLVQTSEIVDDEDERA